VSAFVQSSIDNRIMTIRFNRLDKKNALTIGMYTAAADALEAAAGDPQVRVVVITGTDDCFTAGNDLKDFLENVPRDADAPVFRFMRALSRLPKPAIAAVNGLALGIGTTILLHCDLAYAVPDAVFQTPFVGLGLVPEFASTLLLPRRVGRAAAAEMLFLAETFPAQKAFDLGLLNALVPAAGLEKTVTAKAGVLAAKPPGALRDAKRLLFGDTAETDARIALEAKVFGERLESPEFKEAATAFFERRAPDFSKFE